MVLGCIAQGSGYEVRIDDLVMEHEGSSSLV